MGVFSTATRRCTGCPSVSTSQRAHCWNGSPMPPRWCPATPSPVAALACWRRPRVRSASSSPTKCFSPTGPGRPCRPAVRYSSSRPTRRRTRPRRSQQRRWLRPGCVRGRWTEPCCDSADRVQRGCAADRRGRGAERPRYTGGPARDRAAERRADPLCADRRLAGARSGHSGPADRAIAGGRAAAGAVRPSARHRFSHSCMRPFTTTGPRVPRWGSWCRGPRTGVQQHAEIPS